MRRDPRAYLWDIQQSVQAIQDFVSGRSFEDYEENRMLRSAVEREFLIVGEAMNRLARHDEPIAARVTDYRRIINLQNLIAHEYDEVRNDILWALVDDGLPVLFEEVSGLLEEL